LSSEISLFFVDELYKLLLYDKSFDIYHCTPAKYSCKKIWKRWFLWIKVVLILERKNK